jgi:hypothetical protein
MPAHNPPICVFLHNWDEDMHCYVQLLIEMRYENIFSGLVSNNGPPGLCLSIG